MYRNHAPPRSVRLHITRMLVRTRQSHQRRYARYIPCTVFCGVRWRKDHFPCFLRASHHNMDIATAWTPAGTDSTTCQCLAPRFCTSKRQTAHQPRFEPRAPPPENIPLDVIRLNRAGDSQRNANGLIPGRGDVLNIKRRMRRREDLDHPVISPRLER